MKLLPFILTLWLLVCTTLLGAATFGQPAQPFPAFTLLIEVTDYDPHGNAAFLGKETRYQSSSGNWRATLVEPNRRIGNTVFIPGRGVFSADERNKEFVKLSDCVIAICLPRKVSAEALRADPKFVRTEEVLGHMAYVHQTERDTLTYFVPELSGIAFKRITLINGHKRVEEPVKVTMGEPDASDVRGPDYPLIDERPVFDEQLEARIIEKPTPRFASLTLDGQSSTVTVYVLVDKTGSVVQAGCIGDFAFSRFGRAGEDAAYKARFAPKEVAGKLVRSTGLIRYVIAQR